jgi:hypothetical protein
MINIQINANDITFNNYPFEKNSFHVLYSRINAGLFNNIAGISETFTHKTLVYTNDNNQTYAASVWRGINGKFELHVSAYNGNHLDHPRNVFNQNSEWFELQGIGERVSPVYSKEEAELKWNLIVKTARRIDKLQLEYEFPSIAILKNPDATTLAEYKNVQNSNAFVDTLLYYAGIPRPENDDWKFDYPREYNAPGSGNILNLGQLERKKLAELQKINEETANPLQANTPGSGTPGSGLSSSKVTEFALALNLPVEPYTPNYPENSTPPEDENTTPPPSNAQPDKRPWAYNPDRYVPEDGYYPEQANNGEPPVPEGFNPNAFASDFTAGEGANEVLRRDPLFLDLDGDGVETLSITQWYGYKQVA